MLWCTSGSHITYLRLAGGPLAVYICVHVVRWRVDCGFLVVHMQVSLVMVVVHGQNHLFHYILE